MNNANRSLRSDLDLMACVLLIAVMAVGMMVTGHALVNMAYLGVTLLLLLMTYFFGIVAGLGANLCFIFAQAFYMLYRHLTGASVPLVLAFWLVLPALLCAAFYGVTTRLRQMQADNAALRENMIEHGAFDSQTNLRTTVSFLEDAAVYTETSKRFAIPVATVVIKIRYFSDLHQMLGEQRVQELIDVASNTIQEATRDNDVTYILNTEDPTWAVLLFTDEAGANIAAQRIRTAFDRQLQASKTLADVDLHLKIGVVAWNADEMADVTAFMNAGLKALEYDV